jgi:hypothetical protein
MGELEGASKLKPVDSLAVLHLLRMDGVLEGDTFILPPGKFEGHLLTHRSSGAMFIFHEGEWTGPFMWKDTEAAE